MNTAMVTRTTRPVPTWAFVLTVGVVLVASALGYAFVQRGVAGGLTPDGRMAALTVFALGSVTVAIGIGMPLLGALFPRAGASRLSPGSYRAVLGTTVLVVLISNVPPTIFAVLTSVDGLRSLPGFMFAALSVEITLITASVALLIRSGRQSWATLGFSGSRLASDLGRGLLWGVGAFFVSAILQTALAQAGVRQTQMRELDWIRELDGAGFVLVLAVGAVGAPLAEELFFRGYVFASFLREKGPLAAYLVGGLLFASLHLNKEAFFPIFLLGMMLSWMYRRSGSLVPGITAHALNNGVAFLIFYFAPMLEF